MQALDLLAPGELAEGRPPCPYESLIGSWEIQSRWTAEDGSKTEAEGEWHFSWILGGWGIQDVLFVKGAAVDQRGTSIRCYDASSSCWRVVWMAPRGGEFVSLEAHLADGVISQEGNSFDGATRQRWTIDEITATSFRWQSETSLDGGATWRADQEMHATRRL